MNKEEFFNTVFPALATFLSAVLPALGLWAVTILRSWASKQEEALDRQSLHSALKTGMESAEQKYGDTGTAKQKVEYAIDYAHKSSPDAVRNLSPSTEVMVKLAQSKKQEVKPCPPELSPQSLPLPSAQSL